MHDAEVVDLKRFGRALATFRVAAGFKTHEAAAARTGMERARIAKHEKGTGGMPRVDTLNRYEEAYRLEPGTLSAMLAGDAVSRNEPQRVSRATSPRVADDAVLDLPRALRMRGNEVERELIEAGASEQHVRDFWRSVRESPLLVALFRGGAPSNLSNEEMLQLFDGVALGFRRIVEQLVRQESEARRR